MAERMNVEPGEILAALDTLREQATSAAQRIAQDLELERRLRENPVGTLALAAGAGFVLGGGLWPALRPFLRAAVRTALSPQNLVALAAAAGALKAASASASGSGEEIPSPGEGTPTAH